MPVGKMVHVLLAGNWSASVSSQNSGRSKDGLPATSESWISRRQWEPMKGLTGCPSQTQNWNEYTKHPTPSETLSGQTHKACIHGTGRTPRTSLSSRSSLDCEFRMLRLLILRRGSRE